jgi:hypothetical protein
MTDVLIYWPDYRARTATGDALRWHSNHRVFTNLLPEDRLWVITSGKCLGLENENAGYVIAVWPVAQVVRNPGDDPQYPARKYQYRVLVNETEAIHLEEPVDVDHVIRREGYDTQIPVGRFLRGPRRLTDAKVRLLRSAAGAEMARKWLTASNRRDENGVAAVALSEEQEQT